MSLVTHGREMRCGATQRIPQGEQFAPQIIDLHYRYPYLAPCLRGRVTTNGRRVEWLGLGAIIHAQVSNIRSIVIHERAG